MATWDWSDACPWDADLRGRCNGFFETIDCILLSRPMAAGFVAHRAYAEARRHAGLRIRVAHRRRSEDRRRPRPLEKFVKALKRETGGTIVAFGGENFAAPHIMFFVPRAERQQLGANLLDSPIWALKAPQIPSPCSS